MLGSTSKEITVANIIFKSVWKFVHASCVYKDAKSFFTPFDQSVTKNSISKRGSIMGFLVSFVKNDEIRPSIRMTREKKSTQFLKGTARDLF